MMMMHRLASDMCLLLLVLLCAVRFNTITCCHESDRSLLLLFKQGVVDPSNRLSSWSALQDCCQWEGILCDGNNSVTALVLNNRNQNVSESLRGEINLSSLLELEFLHTLHFDYNDFELMRMPSFNNSVATHTHLLPNSSSSSKLTDLSLSDNIHLHIDNLHYWLSRLPSLQYLNLSGIHLPSETNWVQSLASLPLKELYLYDCNLTTSSLKRANFSSSLSSLDLGLNDFRYGFPNWLFNLSEDLYHLDLSRCNLRGQIPDFSGYRNLKFLDLSHNKLEGLIPDWLGQLDELKELDLCNNLFHSSIPSNLINASSSSLYLDISFNNLSGVLPKILGQNMSHYVISGNKFHAINLVPLPRLNIFMSFNKFKGELPQVSDAVQSLDLAHNSFSGPLSSLLCHTRTDEPVLEYLDLSNNYLAQELPDCWKNWTLLSYIYLGNNQLVGQVPSTMGSSLYDLRALDLRNNGFSGDIPWTVHDCKNLVLLNLEGNNFSGSIHTWIPQSVSIVKLRSNQFTGNISPKLCALSNLIVLDLANNKLSGSIPHCLHNITSFFQVFDVGDLIFYDTYPFVPDMHKFMKIGLHTKGQQLEYEKNLKLVRSIDLSANKLSGEIPEQLFKLTKLQSLNLSYNYLIGEMPKQIGEMKDLESLDLSHNYLHGNIPQSMSSLSFLSDLNMSYNHFSGQIPLGTQLQSFDAWSYTGNPELCGPPLQNNCTIPKKADNPEHGKENEDYGFLKSLYLGMGVGFPVGFWLVCGSLFLNSTWRHAYFQFLNGVVDRIYVIVNIKLQRFR
ncbi:hypothetical protein K1719_023995 [Acacia pycnantha]|nr:hypothetical protein K1719_023995 [Acacia pycnantha]